MSEKLSKKEIERLDKKLEEILNDPDLLKKAEEYQKKYGTISEKDLRKRFTI